MKIEVHLGPAAKPSPSEPALQILLTRCQSTARAAWVSTSFHKAIKQFDRRMVDRHFKSLKKGALPGLVAWLLRKQAGVAEPLSRQVSDQLGELILQGDARRKATWLWAFCGGDPRKFFHQENGVWQPGEALQKAEILALDHETIPSAGNLDPKNGTKRDPAELTEVAANLVPPVLSIEVQFKLIKSGEKAWKRFAPQSEKLTPQHELRITVASSDGNPRHIAVAGISFKGEHSKGEVLGLWPWRPNAPGGWDGQSEIKRILVEERNPKTEVSLPGLWNRDPEPQRITMTAPIECIVAVIYHLEDPTDQVAHSTVLQRLARAIKALHLDPLQTRFAEQRLAVVPGEDQGFWPKLEKLRGQVKERLATGNRDIEFAEAVVLPMEVP